MPRLIHKDTKQTIVQNVLMARSLWDRMKGLIGKTDFPSVNTLWILPCTGIHTFFMKFPIDVIFVNRKLQIKAVFKNIAPSRIIYPPLFSNSHSVFEFKTPALNSFQLEKGNQLYVEETESDVSPDKQSKQKSEKDI